MVTTGSSAVSVLENGAQQGGEALSPEAALEAFKTCFRAIPSDMWGWTGINAMEYSRSLERANAVILESHGKAGGESDIATSLESIARVLSILYRADHSHASRIPIFDTVLATYDFFAANYGPPRINSGSPELLLAAHQKRSREGSSKKRGRGRGRSEGEAQASA